MPNHFTKIKVANPLPLSKFKNILLYGQLVRWSQKEKLVRGNSLT